MVNTRLPKGILAAGNGIGRTPIRALCRSRGAAPDWAWVWATTIEHGFAFSRRGLPEACVSLSLQREGAGNAGCALHPRSRVQTAQKKAHTSIQGSGGNPTFPAQWLYGLYRAHPGVSGVLAPVASRKLALRPGRAFAPPKDLTPTIEASDPHDFAVRFSTARQARPKTAHGVYPALRSHRAHDALASTASHPNVR